VLSLVTLRPPQISPLFPYPTLFRSRRDLGGQLDRAQVLQLLLQLVSVLQTANPTGFLDATDGLDLLLRALGGDDGQVARQQVVAGVAVLDLDDVARVAETGHVSSEDDLHDVSPCRSLFRAAV